MPVVLSKSAAAPIAVLDSALLMASAPAPTPVLKLPVVFRKSDRQPSAVFPAPVVRESSASHPSAVVKLGKHPSGVGDGVGVSVGVGVAVADGNGVGVRVGVGVGVRVDDGVGDGAAETTLTMPTMPQHPPCGMQ